MKKKTIQTFLIVLVVGWAQAQTKISGTITDQKGEVLIGANVFIENTYDGASSDFNGEFEFIASEEGELVLIVTYLGYKEFRQQIEASGELINVKLMLEEAINRLEAVTISAGTFTAGEGTKSEVLKPLDIVTTAGATADISGALNSLPGTQTVGEEGRLYVRGGSGSETKTFIDGMQVLKSYSTTIPNTPTRGRFSPFMFSGTSFSTGGYSAEYGQALSSALILNTKEKPAQNRTDLGLMAVGGELSHTHSWAKSSLAVQGAYYNLKPLFNVVKQKTDWINEPSSMQVSTAVRKTLGNTGIAKGYVNFSSSRMSLLQHDILNPSAKKSVAIDNNYVYANASVKNVLGKSWLYKTGIAITQSTDNIIMQNENIKETTKGGHVKAVFVGEITDRLQINTGGELLYSEFQSRYELPIEGVENSTGYQSPIWANFVETDFYFSNNLLARVGARAEYTSLNKEWKIAPRASLAYKFGDRAQLALAAGTFYQEPTNDMLSIDNKLDAERADHLILNYQWSNINQTLRIEGYFKKYADLVKYSIDDTNLTQTYWNGGNGYAKGIDVFWRDSKSIKNVDYWFSYSYLDTKRDYRDFPNRAVPTFASKHNFSAVYKQFITGIKTQFSGTFTYASPRQYNNPNLDHYNSEKTPSYTDLSLSVSHLATQKIIIYGSITNVLGRENIFGYTYSSSPNAQGEFVGEANTLPAPRFLFVGIFITFSKDATLNQLKSL